MVIGDKVHDVTDIQTQIRAAARYDMKGDAVIAALPTWRGRIEEAGQEGARQAAVVGEAALAGRATVQDHGGADQLRASTSRRCARAPTSRARRCNRPPNIEKAGIFLKSNSSIVGPSEGIPIRFLDRINEHEIELVDRHRQAGHRHSEGQGEGLHRRLHARPRHDLPRQRGPQLPQVDRRLFGARAPGS